jgi:hypothetical protein
MTGSGEIPVRIDLERATLVALALHEHACTVGCALASGGECTADGLTDQDHNAASRLLYELDRMNSRPNPPGGSV